MTSTVINEPLIATARAKHHASDSGSSVGASTSQARDASRPGKGNRLEAALGGGNRTTPEHEASATDLKLSAGGHTDCDVHISPGVGYRLSPISGQTTDASREVLDVLTNRTDGSGGSCVGFGNADRASDAIDDAVQAPSLTGTDLRFSQ